MNSMMMFLAMRGGSLDQASLRQMVQKDNQKRRDTYKKLAELLFGIVMFFFGDLKITVNNADGTAVDATDPAGMAKLTTDQKVNALLAGLKQTNKGNLIREVLRPLFIDAAELLAGMMEPDEMSMNMLSGGFGNLLGSGSSAGPTIHVNTGVPAAGAAPGQAASTSTASSFEGQFLQANDGSKEVYKIVGGQKCWVSSEAAMNRMGNQLVNGRWTNTNYVSPSVLNAFPSGPAIS